MTRHPSDVRFWLILVGASLLQMLGAVAVLVGLALPDAIDVASVGAVILISAWVLFGWLLWPLVRAGRLL